MIELKTFYRRMERAFDDGARRPSPQRFATRWLPHLFEDLGSAFGMHAAHLYGRRDGTYALTGRWGSPAADIAAELRERLIHGGAPLEFPWTGLTAAGDVALLEMDDDAAWIAALFFTRPDGSGASDTTGQLGVLSSLQYAVRQHRQRHELENLVEQARAIQTSLLPAGPVTFAGYDLAAVSLPAQRVGVTSTT